MHSNSCPMLSCSRGAAGNWRLENARLEPTRQSKYVVGWHASPSSAATRDGDIKSIEHETGKEQSLSDASPSNVVEVPDMCLEEFVDTGIAMDTATFYT